MIEKFDLKGVHTTIDANLQKYAIKKLASLDKYLPKHHRDAVHAVVELKQANKASEQKKYTCDVTLHLPHDTTIHVAETTLNMFAAIDIVETKLKQQIKKHKEQHANSKLSRHLTARLRRRTQLMPEQMAE
ncbi:MAG TPA: ribosome-associated translation inhibitor RaiA [Candidatus Microsaccharimonas sp.]|nr:ribosome-associated translation inhibitor RaiA [Candidatus Microsaccharimonas sp.]